MMPPDLADPGGPAPQLTGDAQAWLAAWIARGWRTWRAVGVAYALMCGMAAGLLTWPWPDARWRGAASIAVAVLVLAAMLARRRLRDVRTLLADVEARQPGIANAVLAWHETHATLPPVLAERLARQARDALDGAGASQPYGMRAWSAAVACLIVGVLGLVVGTPGARHGTATTGRGPAAGAAAVPSAVEWTATVIPPAYTRRPPVVVNRPSRLELFAGSRVELRLRGWPEHGVATVGSAALAVAARDTGHVAAFTAEASDVLLLRGGAGDVIAAVALVVRPDAPPATRIVEPAADVRRDVATGRLAIRLTAHDDLGLRDLRLRFTKVSGSGESFTFEDGEWPLFVSRGSPTAWTATHTVDLASLGVAPGDSVVYYAVAHDARPGAEGAAESERYLIEITRAGARASGDYSLPEREERFALSQRMVIQLTERLLEKRPRMSAAEYLREAQAVAMAQRRVRAEFVFMLGGEVEDEVAEAEHSHEVEAGRLDNRGQGELTEAVRQMAQAETRLTDAELREALPYEYRALAAVQAAFGKARYFMRTLPTPVQIDPSRRLRGDRTQAASARWTRVPLPDDRQAAGLALLDRLEALDAAAGAARTAVVPALVALDRGNPEWVALAQRLAGGTGAVGEVAGALRQRLLARAVRSAPVPLPSSPGESAVAATGARR